MSRDNTQALVPRRVRKSYGCGGRWSSYCQCKLVTSQLPSYWL